MILNSWHSTSGRRGWIFFPVLAAFFCFQFSMPWGSMYGIFAYIYHKNQPHVGKYTIHGSSGMVSSMVPFLHGFFYWRQPRNPEGTFVTKTTSCFLWRCAENKNLDGSSKSWTRWLVVSINPFWNIFFLSNWIISRGFGGENETCWKPPPRFPYCEVSFDLSLHSKYYFPSHHLIHKKNMWMWTSHCYVSLPACTRHHLENLHFLPLGNWERFFFGILSVIPTQPLQRVLQKGFHVNFPII